MKPEIKKLWIEALNSDQYPQGRTFLNKDGKFCCLGVLCELYCINVSNIRKTHIRDKVSYAGRQSNLPDIVSVWAGLQIETDCVETLEESEYIIDCAVKWDGCSIRRAR